ncbi:broad substrate specificity ATP-binding cassette transporter ABCG2 isoform X3 [Ictidomys tridecemlineatus]
MFGVAILGLIVGATFLMLKNDCTEIQNRAWALYVLVVVQCLSSVTAGEIFELQKKIFKHEYLSGYYRVLPYFLGELLSELIPRRLFPTIIFNSILYFMLGLKPGVGAFFTLMIIVLLVAYATGTMAMILGAGEKAMEIKTFLVTVYFVFMMVILGMTLNFGTTTPWLSWFEYLSIPHYGYMKAKSLKMSSNNDQVVIPMLRRHTNGLPEMISADGETITQGAVLSFHNICYRGQEKRGSLLRRRIVEKETLWNISGIMKPGLNAIMGPPGGGKSSLLAILSSRRDPCGLTGEVLINGVHQPENFRYNSGYVVQDDVVVHTLSVRENLQFSAALRLPTTMTNQEKDERVNDIMKELKLDGVANSKVRPRELRKRTSIAVELITDPDILFLDEPTTGLDPSTANTVFSLLKSISEQGRTIIFTIHQPRYSIFKLFDSLTLLASGKLMYHGPAQKALEYFESAGYSGEEYQNPADFFLDIINGNVPPINREEENEAEETEQLFQREKPVIEALAEFYANSAFYRDTEAELEHLSGGRNSRSLAFREMTCVTSFFHQLRWIFWRSFKNLLGFRSVTLRQVFATIVLAIVVGGTFRVLKNDCTEIQNRAWGLYVLIVFQCFGSVTAGEMFELEKKLFKHEYISGYYSEKSYFFGKLLSDLIPRRICPSFIFTFILSFMLGLKSETGDFFMTIFIVLLVAYATSSMALVLGAGEKAMDVKTFLVNIYLAVMTIFLGITLNFEMVKPWLSWLQYFSIPYYGYMALLHNEFLGRNFCPGLSPTESRGCASYVICTGEEYLTMLGIDLSPLGLWKNLLGLACMIILFLIITYLKLIFLKNHF